MLVYRVQDERGCGPYAGRNMDKEFDLQDEFTHDLTWHPVEGWEDENPQRHCRRDGNLRWAFISINQLRRWFDHFGEAGYSVMRDADYIIAVFEVPAEFVWCYLAQATYDHNEATWLHDEELPCM